MRFLLVMLLYAVGSALAMRAVVYGACLFLWSDIFQPLEFARNPGRLPVAQFVTGMLLLAYLVAWFRGKMTPRFGTFFFLLCGLMAWVGLTAVLSPFRQVAMDQFILYLKYVGPLALIHTALHTKQDIRILSAALVGSVGVWAAQAGVFCLIHGAKTDIGIPGGQMGDRNDFAAAIVGTLPLLIYFMLSYNWKFKWPVRALLGLVIFLSLNAIFFSLSRGASVGLAAATLLYIGYVSKRKLRDTILLIAACGVLVLLLPQSWYDRMNTIKVGGEQTEGSAVARMNLLKGAWRCSLDHPLFGLGPGGWLEVAEAYTGDNHNPHNIYLVLTTETGMPGLMFYLVVIIYTYVRISQTINRALRRGDSETARLGAALIMAIFGLLSAMTFLNRPFNEFLWAWVAAANALPVIYERDLAKQNRGRAAGRNAKGAKPKMKAQAARPRALPETSPDSGMPPETGGMPGRDPWGGTAPA